jgi:probable rRNA maturation factor
MIDIHIRKPFLKLVDKNNLRSSLNLVVSYLIPNEKIGLSLLICSDEEIQQLNCKYRDLDMPTDVLSFGLEERIPDFQERFLGDIIISYETASKQSQFMEHSAITEIKILAIHGFLHLMGFDHDTKAKKEKMWDKQIEILNLLGIKASSFSGEND